MKALFKSIMAAFLAAVCLTACQSEKSPFASVGEDDAPRILNTDIPEGSAGQPGQLLSIERTANFTFSIIVTPVKYTTVMWNIDGEDVFEGSDIYMSLYAGNHLVKVTATTIKGLSTSRTFTVAVSPKAEDPVLDVDRMMAAPLQTLVLEGSNLDLVQKVILGSYEAEIVSAEANSLTIVLPEALPTGLYPVFFQNEAGEKLAAVCPSGNIYESFKIAASTDPMVAESSFKAKAGDNVTLGGINLDKVQSVLVGEESAQIVSQSADELVFTCPELEAGEYALTGTATNGVTVIFGEESAAILTVVDGPEVTLWEGSFEVTWGTPFNELQSTLADLVNVGDILRAYVSGNGQGSLATAWWRNLETGYSDDDPEGRGDTVIDGEVVLELTVTELSMQLLAEQEGFFLVGNGYTVTKITVEPPTEQTVWEGSFDVTWGTPFDAIKETLLGMVKVGTIVRGYVSGEGQGCLATSWWNNIYTGESDPNRGDSTISGEMVLEYTLTQVSLDLLAEQDGALFVGNGYTITRVTIE